MEIFNFLLFSSWSFFAAAGDGHSSPTEVLLLISRYLSWCSVTLATIVISSSIFPNRLSLLASSYCLLHWSWIWVKNMQNNCNDRSSKHLYRTKIPQQQISGEVDCWQANWTRKSTLWSIPSTYGSQEYQWLACWWGNWHGRCTLDIRVKNQKPAGNRLEGRYIW